MKAVLMDPAEVADHLVTRGCGAFVGERDCGSPTYVLVMGPRSLQLSLYRAAIIDWDDDGNPRLCLTVLCAAHDRPGSLLSDAAPALAERVAARIAALV